MFLTNVTVSTRRCCVTSCAHKTVKRLVFEADIGRPFKIRRSLLKKKNNFSSIPELRQIQNFLYQMRKKFGDTNKIEDIKKYDRRFEHIQSADDLFFFRERFGDEENLSNRQ